MKLSRDFARPSTNDYKLSDRQMKKYDKGHTLLNQGGSIFTESEYFWFPQNKTRKFIYDVNKEAELQNALQSADDPELYARAEELEKNLRNPYKSYLGNLLMSSSGYHDRAKHVKERNDIINTAMKSDDSSLYDEGGYGTTDKVLSRVFPIYQRSRVQDAKNSYRDLVQATAALPEEDRKKVFKKFEESTTKKGVGAGVGTVVPVASLVKGVTDYKNPEQYRELQDSFENIL